MFIIMLIITSNNRARRLDEFFQKRNGSTRTGGVVSTKLERCSTLYRLVASVDLHNYRARFETAEFFEKKKSSSPIFSPFFPPIFIPLSSSFFRLDARPRLFPRVKRVAGGKIVSGEC